MTSRIVTVLSLLTAIVGCVAAVVVIPEVRCMLGLPTTEARCPRGQSGTGLSTSLLPEESGVEAAVGRIAALYRHVERQHHTGGYDSLRKEITGAPGDSAYATIYHSGGQLGKIRARIYHGNERTSYLAYYDDGDALAFVHRVSHRPPNPVSFDEQRFYFARGRLVRWLRGKDKRNVAADDAEYAGFEQDMRTVGTRLLQGARSPDALITF